MSKREDLLSIQIDLQIIERAYSHAHANVQFADRKATAVTTIDTGIAAGFFAIGALGKSNGTLLGISVIGLALIAVAVFLGVQVVRPRGGLIEKHGPGVLEVSRVPLNDTFKDFAAKFQGMSAEDVLEEALQCLHSMAAINQRKYRVLNWLLWVSYAAWGWLLVASAFSLFGT